MSYHSASRNVKPKRPFAFTESAHTGGWGALGGCMPWTALYRVPGNAFDSVYMVSCIFVIETLEAVMRFNLSQYIVA